MLAHIQMPKMFRSVSNKTEKTSSKAEIKGNTAFPLSTFTPEASVWADHVGRPENVRGVSDGAGTAQNFGLAAPVLTTQLLLEHQITDYEERLKTAMGPMALYGLRYFTLVGLAAATLVKIGIAVAPMTTPLVPLVGMGIFLGLVVGGIILGAAMQSYARHKFRKTDHEYKQFLKELCFYENQLEHKTWLSGTEVRQLRRLQILRANISGGFSHSLWSVLHSITGFDPQLNSMMRKANKDRPLGPQTAAY